MYPTLDPIIIQIGPLALRWYGVLMMAGILAASWVAARYVARKGEDPNTLWDMLFWVLIPGLIGARLYYVFVQSPRGPNGLDRYLANPLEILQIWEGGLHIFGGFLFGAAALLLYARANKLNTPVYLDGVALGLPLGQAIARNANFINQELYGPPTTLPWGLRIDDVHRIEPYNLERYPEATRFHPLFLYEVIWSALGFALLLWVSRRFAARLRDGDLALLYLIWYPLGRFFIEFLRTDSWFFPGTPFNVVHLIAAIVIVAALSALIVRHRRIVDVEPETLPLEA
ncbi:MAG: prolipoprotein diacylglyceryl transferase [Roseiflexaceae bacterium]|nr:prolipoprotein diacylglyceryl transferase [Roseiflexaceae bacterium]